MNMKPCMDITQPSRQDSVESAIRNIHRHSAQVLAQQGLAGKQLELLVIILPDISGSYGKLCKLFTFWCLMISVSPTFHCKFLTFNAGRIKRLCETELGVITQCCLPKNVQKGGKQYFENLSMKINVKVCLTSYSTIRSKEHWDHWFFVIRLEVGIRSLKMLCTRGYHF